MPFSRPQPLLAMLRRGLGCDHHHGRTQAVPGACCCSVMQPHRHLEHAHRRPGGGGVDRDAPGIQSGAWRGCGRRSGELSPPLFASTASGCALRRHRPWPGRELVGNQTGAEQSPFAGPAATIFGAASAPIRAELFPRSGWGLARVQSELAASRAVRRRRPLCATAPPLPLLPLAAGNSNRDRGRCSPRLSKHWLLGPSRAAH